MARPGRCASLGAGLTALGLVLVLPPLVPAGIVLLAVALASVAGRWHPIRHSRRRLATFATRLQATDSLRRRGAAGFVYSWTGRGVLRCEPDRTLRFVPGEAGLSGAVVAFDGAHPLHRGEQLILGTLADTATEAGGVLVRWLEEQADLQLRAELTAGGRGPVVLSDGVHELIAHGRAL
jgi:hypothetical protein